MLSDPWCGVVLQHIWALEGEREARGQEATEAAQRHAQALEQVKLRDMAAADLQKKVPFPALPYLALAYFLSMPFFVLIAYLHVLRPCSLSELTVCLPV